MFTHVCQFSKTKRITSNSSWEYNRLKDFVHFITVTETMFIKIEQSPRKYHKNPFPVYCFLSTHLHFLSLDSMGNNYFNGKLRSPQLINKIIPFRSYINQWYK